MSDKSLDYFNYLKTKSTLGTFYRKFYLYPVLNKYLNGKVIDIGCGLGDFLKFRPSTIGVDINIHNVKYCRQKQLTAFLIQEDKINFNNNFFNGAILDNVLEHIISPDKILNETHRILNNEGVLIVGVPGIKGYHADSDHKIFYDKGLLIKTIEKFGFKMKKIKNLPLPFLSKTLNSFCIYGIFTKCEKI